MATYVTLIRWTQKGIENVKESPARFDAAKKIFQAMGCQGKKFLYGDRPVRHGHDLRSAGR
jgi:uncharacterized protein with GYD domain